MDEVDKIIIKQLRDLDCEINKDTITLADLNQKCIINCVIKLLALCGFEPQDITKYEEGMNMVDKYKLVIQLGDFFHELGYKGDQGFQTLLYGNQQEVRKIFVFLIEHLSTFVEEEPKLRKNDSEIKKKLKNIVVSFKKKETYEKKPYLNFEESPEISEAFNSKLVMKNDNEYLINTFNPPFHKPLSILDWNSKRIAKSLDSEKGIKIEILNTLDFKFTSDKNLSFHKKYKDIGNDQETVLEKNEDKQLIKQLEEKLNTQNAILIEKQENLKELSKVLEQKNKKLEKENYFLEVFHSDLTHQEIEQELIQMKKEIALLKERLLQFKNECIKVETLPDLNINRNRELIALQIELKHTRKSIKKKKEQYNSFEKKIVELKSLISLEPAPKRIYYIKQVLAILNEIKKGEEDSKKILQEIQNFQREINTLTGKVDRAFRKAEKITFENCPYEDWSRQCYRQLPILDDNYDKLCQLIEEIGQTIRENLDLEEQIEKEKSNEMAQKIERTKEDLEQLRNEIRSIV